MDAEINQEYIGTTLRGIFADKSIEILVQDTHVGDLPKQGRRYFVVVSSEQFDYRSGVAKVELTNPELINNQVQFNFWKTETFNAYRVTPNPIGTVNY